MALIWETCLVVFHGDCDCRSNSLKGPFAAGRRLALKWEESNMNSYYFGMNTKEQQTKEVYTKKQHHFLHSVKTFSCICETAELLYARHYPLDDAILHLLTSVVIWNPSWKGWHRRSYEKCQYILVIFLLTMCSFFALCK